MGIGCPDFSNAMFPHEGRYMKIVEPVAGQVRVLTREIANHFYMAVRFYQNYQAVSVLEGVYRLRLAAPGSPPFLRSPARAANVARFFGRDLPHCSAP